MKYLLALIFFISSSAFSMSEQECEPQAKVAFEYLDMINSQVVVATEKQTAKFQKAADLYKQGRFCEARALVLGFNRAG